MNSDPHTTFGGVELFSRANCFELAKRVTRSCDGNHILSSKTRVIICTTLFRGDPLDNATLLAGIVKLAVAGQQAGITVEQMIALLKRRAGRGRFTGSDCMAS